MRISCDEINRLKKDYSQAILSPENILSSFEEKWRGENTLQFLLNQGLAPNTPYIVRDIYHYRTDNEDKILIGLSTGKKEGACEFDYFYSGFFDFINFLTLQPKKSRDFPFQDKQLVFEQLIFNF